jgi:hypothetical protein
MIVLYHLVLFVLGTIKLVFAQRAAALERKFARLAKEMTGLVRDPIFKEGNSCKQDPYLVAKRQYLLGSLVQKKDRLEAKYERWALRAEKLAWRVTKLRAWKGRLLPYIVGVLDVVAVRCLADYLSRGELVNLRQLFSLLTSGPGA